MQTCINAGLVDPSEVFIDATHVKACANSNKLQQKAVQEEALFYEEQLKKEINEDRIAHGKKPLKDKDNDFTDSLPAWYIYTGEDTGKTPERRKNKAPAEQGGRIYEFGTETDAERPYFIFWSKHQHEYVCTKCGRRPGLMTD